MKLNKINIITFIAQEVLLGHLSSAACEQFLYTVTDNCVQLTVVFLRTGLIVHLVQPLSYHLSLQSFSSACSACSAQFLPVVVI